MDNLVKEIIKEWVGGKELPGAFSMADCFAVYMVNSW